jgi:hypothetical protein
VYYVRYVYYMFYLFDILYMFYVFYKFFVFKSPVSILECVLDPSIYHPLFNPLYLHYSLY